MRCASRNYLAWVLAAAVALGMSVSSIAAERPGPESELSDRSYYLEMRDGIRVALSLYFPDGRPPAAPTPTLLIQTRYGRASVFIDGGYRSFVDDGYTVAIIDTRGSTSSFGAREVDIGPEQVRDIDEVIEHLATRPWSNGEVYVTGVSYMADTADVATSRPTRALKGGVIRQADFDVWNHLFFPGGVKNDWFLQSWGDRTYRMDNGLSLDPAQELNCRLRAADCAKLWPMLQTVEEDKGYELLRQALATRKRWTPDTYRSTEYRDDIASNGYPLFQSSPAHHLSGIRRQSIPVQYWGSWMDAGTAEAALARYRSAPEAPMEVWITANNHSNTVAADPFFPGERTARPAVADQLTIMRTFLRRVERREPIVRAIRYYVLGARQFKTTSTWPPSDTREVFLAMGPDRNLQAGKQTRQSIVRHTVDFSSTTGRRTRWSTQFGIDPDYRDRREEDRKLLVYDSAPFEQDMELAGTPVLRLDIATRTRDPAVHAYLEDVAPNGRVTYLTEGMLRLVHRKPADSAALPYDQGSAPHSFKRADALPMVPHEFAIVEFALMPVAARISIGHHLRIAIAGADDGTFHRYSENGPEEFTVRSTPPEASGVTVHLRVWQKESP